MKIKYLIDTLLSPTISALDWVGRYGGLVQTINYQASNSDPSKSNPIKRYPVACDVEGKDCANISVLQSLSPDDSKLSVVYWEELSPMTDRGVTKTGNFFFRKFEGTARIVVWMNLRKLGQTGCSSPIEAQKQLEEIIINRKSKLVGGSLDGSFFEILPAKGVKKDIQTIFGKYDYNKLIPYYLPPFDYFAIDVNFKLEQCLSSGDVFSPSASIDCVNGGGVEDSCDALLAKLTEDQKNECILPAYDFGDDVVWGNTTLNQQAEMTSRLCASDFVNEYAMQFSGTNYINGGNYSAIDFAHTDPFTLSCRIIADDWTQTRMIMGKRNATGIGYNLFSQAGKLRIVFRGGITSNAIIIDTVDSMVNGQEYHVLVSYTGSTMASGVVVYIDGLAVAKNDVQSNVATTLSNTSNYNTGGSNGAFLMRGVIDCERVWNIALSAADALSEANGGVPKAPLYPNNLVLWDKMGDDATFDGTNWTLANPGLIGGSKSVGMNLASRILTPFV